MARGKRKTIKYDTLIQTLERIHAARYFILTLLTVGAILYFNQMSFSGYFPIKTVKVFGVAHMDRNEVLHLIEPYVKRGFFAVDVDKIKSELIHLPWVSNVFVRREWPRQVDVTIIEKNVVALWSGDTLLTDEGELFRPDRSTYPTNLPHFIGPDGSQLDMLHAFRGMNSAFASIGATIVSLEFTPMAQWKIMLDNGVQLRIDSKDTLTRLSHFVKVYPKVVGNNVKDVEYIDLRYANGMAVRWRKQPKNANA